MTTKKKILIDGRLLSNKNTGISRYTQELISSYIKEYGVSNLLVIINPSFIPEQKLDYHITRLKPFNLLHSIFFYLLVRRMEFEVFHSPFYAGLIFQLSNRIKIITVHDLMYRIIKGYFSDNAILNYFAVLYFDILVGCSLQNSDLIISVSHTTQQDVTKFFNKKSIVVREGVNSLQEMETGNSAQVDLNSFDIERNGFFLYVGNLRKQKNISFLVRSFSKSKSTKKLVICGNYSEKQFAQSIPYSLRYSPRIKFLGFVNDGMLKSLYENCSAFIYPSLYEGFGLPILEAISHGARVFSSNRGALIEFGSELVYFFDPLVESELIDLIEEVDNLSVMKQGSKELIRKFNWTESLQEMHSTIRTLFAK